VTPRFYGRPAFRESGTSLDKKRKTDMPAMYKAQKKQERGKGAFESCEFVGRENRFNPHPWLEKKRAGVPKRGPDAGLSLILRVSWQLDGNDL